MIRRLVKLASHKQLGTTNQQPSKFTIMNSCTYFSSLCSQQAFHRFSTKKLGNTKSTQTSTFHKTPFTNGEPQVSSLQFNLDEDECPELNELKEYFTTQEQDDLDQNDEFLEDDERGLTQFDLNEGGESDFSEEFEKAIQNSNSKRLNNEKCLFDSKSSQNIGRNPQQKGLFSALESQQGTEQIEESQEKKGLMYLRKNKNHPTFLEKKFGLNISSDPRERQADLQKFVLKALQLLNAKQIQHFIQIIEYFKSKLTTHNFKKSQNVHEEFFMKQVYKLFENNQADELMDLFLKCDLIDININLFNNNVVDYEKQYEIKNKFKQFDSFCKQNQPNGNHFLLNELAEKYNNIDYYKYSSLQHEDLENQIDELDIDTFDKSSTHHNKNYSQNESAIEHQQEDIYKQKQVNEFKKSSKESSNVFEGKNKQTKQIDSTNVDIFQGEIAMDKEHQLFQKVTMYEYEKHGSIKNLDSKLFEQLTLNENKNSIQQKYDIFKNDSLQKNWNSSLLDEQEIPLNTLPENSLSINQNLIFSENLMLEPTVYSQQKIMQIGRQFESQFDNNLSLIDDIENEQSMSNSSNLPLVSNQASAINIKLQEKDFYELLNLESERAAITTKKINRIHNNKMVLKSAFEVNVQQSDEVILLKQEKNLIPKKFEKSNWVYLYNLPYDLNEVPNYTTYLKKFIESSFGEIEDMNFFNYREFFEIERVKGKEDPIHRNLRDSLQEQYIQTNVTSNSPSSPNGEKTKRKSTKTGINALNDDELLEHIYQNNQINPDFCNKTLKRTEKILEKIQNKREKKFNRSYAMIKFKTYEQKEKVLSQDIRLFGIQNFNEMFYFDDADYKRTLIITKIPWGIKIEYLINKINQQLNKCGLKHVKISTENINLSKILTNYYLMVKMNDFNDSLDVVNAFKKHEFFIENYRLACHHSHGSLKQGPQGFYEIVDTYSSVYKQELLERVQERKVFEIWNIYKENTGYLNTIRGNMPHDSQDSIEIKEDELEDYNEYDTEKISASTQSNYNFQPFNSSAAGFSKSQQYSQQRSMSDYGYYEPQEQQEEQPSNDLIEEIINKKK
ncbi:hypothetical protein TTHERM_00046950 (macronuclear) [Tetrahymena thermophila SB210]|uniref:Uncharacterized protein n=1 Tax=Tetrahymena thermophila (strain SB210) TaxID=312017 RepID=Q23DJ6_TETTS|nr:hypothetical protein TTHERM_00046950 [Tetrahymena thermophila SB210]EAR94361.1 hypothetical protein TTHERM_00046950 [Tetrahymena thermophila SB210]|eukprot:XP_001014690.1 hypothetical protein TTHERM_00046950 [Tetrahymena thermophila SB210]